MRSTSSCAGIGQLVSRPSEYVRFARTRLLTRAALIRAATVRERSAQRTELRSRDTSLAFPLALLVVYIHGQRGKHALLRAGIRCVPALDRAPQDSIQALRGSRVRHGPFHAR